MVPLNSVSTTLQPTAAAKAQPTRVVVKDFSAIFQKNAAQQAKRARLAAPMDTRAEMERAEILCTNLATQVPAKEAITVEVASVRETLSIANLLGHP